MLTLKSTPNLSGVEIRGDYDDLNALYDAISIIVGDESYEGYYACETRLLGLCYEIRHAYQGDRNTSLSNDNSKYYSFYYFWPEIIFTAAVLGDFISLAESKKCWLIRDGAMIIDEIVKTKMINHLPNDIAYLRYFQNLIWNELKRTIGQKRFTKVFGVDETRLRYNVFEQSFIHYCTQMVDILNVKYIKWKPERRESYLATVAEKLLKQNYDYDDLEDAVLEYAKEQGVPYYEIELEGMQYPEEIEW